MNDHHTSSFMLISKNPCRIITLFYMCFLSLINHNILYNEWVLHFYPWDFSWLISQNHKWQLHYSSFGYLWLISKILNDQYTIIYVTIRGKFCFDCYDKSRQRAVLKKVVILKFVEIWILFYYSAIKTSDNQILFSG